MTRAEFDALLSAALDAIMADAPSSGSEDPATQAAAHDAVRDVQLLEASARSFADAVDRDAAGRRQPIPYGDAVVLEGPSGVAVVSARNYADAPIYWQTVVGQAESITDGTALIPYLQTAAARPARTS